MSEGRICYISLYYIFKYVRLICSMLKRHCIQMYCICVKVFIVSQLQHCSNSQFCVVVFSAKHKLGYGTVQTGRPYMSVFRC